ncbi:uncharacterized protein LOC122056965 isoform X7 [Macadamia integrifolia]|uniref:uncharacterized protein LOC122056965 isoform X7 n=1 Tax=Macadamia integrifolia TaxID=60698 RepID=UPI001C52FFEF|nr:uncharacterized protein LOC122056965 isoform X7 [Macadamia integrifolia]
MIPVRVIGRSSNMFLVRFPFCSGLEKHHPTFRFFRQNEKKGLEDLQGTFLSNREISIRSSKNFGMVPKAKEDKL